MSINNVSFECEVRKMCINDQRDGCFEQNCLIRAHVEQEHLIQGVSFEYLQHVF